MSHNILWSVNTRHTWLVKAAKFSKNTTLTTFVICCWDLLLKNNGHGCEYWCMDICIGAPYQDKKIRACLEPTKLHMVKKSNQFAGLPQKFDFKIPWLFPDSARVFPDHKSTLKDTPTTNCQKEKNMVDLTDTPIKQVIPVIRLQ